jgi:acylphosphatase
MSLTNSSEATEKQDIRLEFLEKIYRLQGMINNLQNWTIHVDYASKDKEISDYFHFARLRFEGELEKIEKEINRKEREKKRFKTRNSKLRDRK